MGKKTEWVPLISKFIMWVLGILLIYFLLLKILGESPTSDTIFAVTLGMLGANVMYLNYQLGKIDSNIKHLSNQFQALASDFKKHLVYNKKIPKGER